MKQFVTHLEDVFEVVGAGREDHLVGRDVLVVADQGHVHELILAPQLAHAAHDVGLVVGPLDAELCTRHPCLPHKAVSCRNPAPLVLSSNAGVFSSPQSPHYILSGFSCNEVLQCLKF